MKQPELWRKINGFQIDDPNSSFTFTQRLARDNNWSFRFSTKVIEEYKKFIYLCCCGYGQVTPSDAVDQAWHQHLTYTKSYWIEFCQNTLGKEVHHNPTKGGKLEDSKFSNCYDSTFEVYKLEFSSEPPIEIWPTNEDRFSDINFKRINLSKYWLVNKSITKFQTALCIAAVVLIGSFIQSKESFPWFGMIVGVIALLFMLRGLIAGFRGKKHKKRRSGKVNHNSGTDASGVGFFGGFFGDFWNNDNDHSGCSSSGCSSGCGGGGCGSGCGD